MLKFSIDLVSLFVKRVNCTLKHSKTSWEVENRHEKEYTIRIESYVHSYAQNQIKLTTSKTRWNHSKNLDHFHTFVLKVTQE